jgi:hypothetical protein
MEHGWPQGFAVSIMRRVRLDLEREHARMEVRRLSPDAARPHVAGEPCLAIHFMSISCFRYQQAVASSERRYGSPVASWLKPKDGMLSASWSNSISCSSLQWLV